MTNDPIPVDDYPWWVNAGLTFGRSRATQRRLALLWIIGVVVCVALMYMTDDFGIVTLFFIGSLGSLVFAGLHRATQQWVDANGEWPT